MKKNIIICCCLYLVNNCGYSQKKDSDSRWYFTADVESIVHNKVEYDYLGGYDGNLNYVYGETVLLKPTPMAFGLTGTINYKIFNRFSLGLATGLKRYNKPNFSMVELGVILKYFFSEDFGLYAYGSLTSESSLIKNQFNSGSNARFGMGIPIVRNESYDINLSFFKEQNFLRLDKSRPLLGDIAIENPSTLIYRGSYGMGIGISF
jgi:hypothetical protein